MLRPHTSTSLTLTTKVAAMKHVNLTYICSLGCALALALAGLSYTAVGETGVADVMSSLYVDQRVPGCSTLHLGEDYLYLTPKSATNETLAWREITSGPGLVDKYKVLTGDEIRVRYKDTTTAGGRRRLLSQPVPELEGIDVVSETEGHEIYTNETIRVKSMIYIIRTCGWNASATVQEIQDLYFNAGFNINGYHNTCTYGKVSYDPSENFVFGPVDIPCNGTVNNGALRYNYNANTACGASEQFAWRQYAEAAARDAGYGAFFNSTTRRRIVHILPREVTCPWAGLGSVGCGSSACTVYIKGAYAKSLTVNMHELGHTQGLSHAGQGFDEYGDYTDVMGTARSEGYLCMNVGNQFRVGWNKPIATLLPTNTSVAGNTPTGIPGRWVIPATNLTDANTLYINYSRSDTPFPILFVSYRVRGARYDNVLPTTNNRKVHVHVFNGTASDRDYNRTLLVATLGASGVYTSPFVDRNGDPNSGGGVKVIVLRADPLSATVDVCRLTMQVESGPNACSDGIDNDCDGKADSDDPSCNFPPPPLLL